MESRQVKASPIQELSCRMHRLPVLPLQCPWPRSQPQRALLTCVVTGHTIFRTKSLPRPSFLRVVSLTTTPAVIVLLRNSSLILAFLEASTAPQSLLSVKPLAICCGERIQCSQVFFISCITDISLKIKAFTDKQLKFSYFLYEFYVPQLSPTTCN